MFREHDMMRPRGFSFSHALRNVLLTALVGVTVALGPLRDALVYAPNGAEVDHAGTGSATVQKAR
jgi:hypothetical protein